MTHSQGQKGFIGLYLTIVVLVVMVGIIASIGFGALTQQKIIQNMTQSAQSYFAAESGIEDALLRLKKGLNACNPSGSPPCSNTFGVASASATTTISAIVAGARTITVEGDSLNRFRNVQIVYEISSTTPGFFYGAHIGAGGLVMSDDSRINGNVFSNGTVDGATNARITGTVQVAGAGNRHRRVAVTGDVYADRCESASISGVLHANTQSGCSYASITTSGLPVVPVPLPISSTMIQDWKDEADATIISGNYTRSSGVSFLGPAKITGNLLVQSTAQLVLTGTLWVQGTVTIKNDARVRLDASYGSTSGVIISDSLITLLNDSVSSGSGSAGSYLMYLSTYPGNPALNIEDDTAVDILYTNNGWILIGEDAHIREVTGYGLHLEDDVQVTYELGLQDAAFTSGPGGGWTVTSWKEIE